MLCRSWIQRPEDDLYLAFLDD
jgi:hypothetical protein